MADQQPGEPDPAAGPPDPTRAGSTHPTQAAGTDSTRAGGTDSTRAADTHPTQAAGTDSTRAGSTDSTQAAGTHPTQAAGTDSTRAAGTDDPSTVDAPARWRGSAAVPPPAPKKPRWPRRHPEPSPPPARDLAPRSIPHHEPAPAPAPAPASASASASADRTTVDPDDWATTPAVDPWAGQDTPWDPFPAAPEVTLPPTRLEALLPPTRIEQPVAAPPPAQPSAPPPTRPSIPPSAPQSARPSAPYVPASPPAPVKPAPPSLGLSAAPEPPVPQPSLRPPAGAEPPVPQPPVRPAKGGRWGRKPKQTTPAVNRLPVQPRPAPSAPTSGATSAPPWSARIPMGPPHTPAALPRTPAAPPRPPVAQPVPPPAPPRAPVAPPTPPAGPIVQGRRLPAPPPWALRQPQRPLPPPRRKRRWGRRIALLGLLGVVCCCGGPVAWFTYPAARQYPVAAALPATFADLTKRDDRASAKAADRLARQLLDTGANADDVFAGVYGDGNGKRVTVFGATGWRFTPGSDVRAQIDRLSEEFNVTGVQPYDTGQPGVHEQCGVGRNGDTSVVVCAWADHGSLAAVLLTRRSIADSADLVGRLRSAVLSPGLGGQFCGGLARIADLVSGKVRESASARPVLGGSSAGDRRVLGRVLGGRSHVGGRQRPRGHVRPAPPRTNHPIVGKAATTHRLPARRGGVSNRFARLDSGP